MTCHDLMELGFAAAAYGDAIKPEAGMGRYDLIDCPDLMELGLMAAAHPDFIEKAIAAMLGAPAADDAA